MDTVAAHAEWRRDFAVGGATITGIVAMYEISPEARRYVALIESEGSRPLRLDAKSTRGGAERACERYAQARRESAMRAVDEPA